MKKHNIFDQVVFPEKHEEKKNWKKKSALGNQQQF